jgi:hypothetical protein
MPNWCHNTLEVTGDSEDIIAFINKARRSPDERDQPLFFTNFVPEPEYSEEQEGGTMPVWWHWRIENWGTKWEPTFETPAIALGASEAEPGAEKERLSLEDAPNGEMRVSYEFDTAWAPPIQVIFAASRQHPDLHFRLTYGEPGDGYGGLIEIVGGLIVAEEDGEAEEYLPPEKMWF